jgi:hypothetical protein
MKRIVCDTGPLIHLGEAGVRELLSPAGDVHIPIAVDLEKGFLGLVLWAAAMGHLSRPEAETALDRLARSSLWVSPSVLLAAKAALNQMA